MFVLGCLVTALPKVHAAVFRFQTTARYFSSYGNMSVIEKEAGHATLWNPMNILNLPSNYKYAVIVLNRPIHLSKSIMLPMWQKAQVTITVDGGTDRWMRYLGGLADGVYTGENRTYAPTMITGDMDSISSDTRAKLERVGVPLITTPDQNDTDYTKALIELMKHCESRNIKLDGIYVIVDTSGRFDHIIGNVNTLYKSPKIVKDTQVIQVANDSLTWLLRPGKHRIIIDETLIKAKGWCGIVPFGTRVDKTSTTGLKWNLDNLAMEFGGLISTSNTYDENCTEVAIDVNEKFVWTMGVEPLFDRFHSS